MICPHWLVRMFGAGPLSIRHLLLITLFLLVLALPSESSCNSGCEVALASYYVSLGRNLTSIASLFGFAPRDIDPKILLYNPNIANKDSIQVNTRVNIPFPCDCIDGAYLAHAFQYKVVQSDTYDSIAADTYAGLTTAAWLEATNSFPVLNIPDGTVVNVTVNCSCGDAKVSERYGHFATYPLRPGQTLDSVAREISLPDAELLLKYNPGLDFSSGSGIAFVPARDRNGNFTPLIASPGGGHTIFPSGTSRGAIAGISIAAVVTLTLAVGTCIILGRRKIKKVRLLSSAKEVEVAPSEQAGTSPVIGITVDKVVRFSYEELAKATNNFSMEALIGRGGFGEVYYADLRGEKVAIKKMAMEESRQFLTELKVLSRVHHLNVVRLIGYCNKRDLFLVYEYIENGNLSQHLHGSGNMDLLPWSTRLQIALDSARGLEYIHEHSGPVCIHRDIKSANILIDKNYHAKVGDFGLARLTEVGNSISTNVVRGTHGYLPPDSLKLSPKLDVYAFGVVLYELISARKALVETDAEPEVLAELFAEVFRNPDPREDLRKLVDPRLGDDYSIEDVYKLAQLAKACTHEKSGPRPTMRRVVVDLAALLSGTEEWNVGQLSENLAVVSGDSDDIY